MKFCPLVSGRSSTRASVSTVVLPIDSGNGSDDSPRPMTLLASFQLALLRPRPVDTEHAALVGALKEKWRIVATWPPKLR